ncbi:MAG: alanine racemase [Patescibacteria group bacterium]
MSQGALKRNYNFLSQMAAPLKVAPVVKSNAYGHGIELVGSVLDSCNPPFFCVDSLFEAYQLKNSGINSEILVMGFVDARNIQVKKLPFAYTVFDLDFAKALNRYQPGAKVHIKVDTGMNRLGVSTKNLPNFLDEIRKLKKVKVVGLMSHLASANSSKAQTNSQMQSFKDARKIVHQKSLDPKWFHVAASDGLFNINKKVLGTVSNLTRVGIALYGADEYGKTTPVLKLTSKIVQIKDIQKGGKVGYDGTYRAPSPLKIALLPIGYNDGLDRRLSQIGVLSYKNNKCKILGRISMNITAVDISDIKRSKIGDEITVISNKPGNFNSVNKLARICSTIPHDLLVRLHAKSIRRTLAP